MNIPLPLLVKCCQELTNRNKTGSWETPGEIPACFYELAKVVNCITPYSFETGVGDLNWLLVLEGIIAKEAIKIVAKSPITSREQDLYQFYKTQGQS